MKHLILLSFITISIINSTFSQEKEVKALIKTSVGDITIKLYNETPKHRDNFIKLIEDDTYSDLLFHRVINSFMIQGGDPNSKNATADTKLGSGGLGYTIPPEFNNNFIHKKGALAAARQGDNVNPKQESSSCQFYIVDGKTYTEQQMKGMEAQKNKMAKSQIANHFLMKPENATFKQRYIKAQSEKNQDAINQLRSEIEPLINAEMAKHNDFKYSEKHIKEYTTIGGTPHLDGAYTVFGEVIEGLEVIDKIASVTTLPGDRPEVDVKFSISIIK